MFFAYVLYGHKAEECDDLGHEANRCTFWTSCIGVSWKQLWVQLAYGVGNLAGTEITLKTSYLGCFWLSSCLGYMVQKIRHYSAEGTPLHMFHEHYTTRD